MLWFGDDKRDGPDRRAHESAEEKEPRRIGEQIWIAGPQRQREREGEREYAGTRERLTSPAHMSASVWKDGRRE